MPSLLRSAVFRVVSAPGLGTPATLDLATITGCTLSGGNLIATSTGTTSADQGARVASASGKSTGKYYFEVTLTTLMNGLNRATGIGTTGSTYTAMGGGGTTGIAIFMTGNAWSMGAQILAWASWAQGQVVGHAVDLDNRRLWYRGLGNWNNSGTADPSSPSTGLVVPAGIMVPMITFGGTNGLAGVEFRMNFGATAFSRPVPAGFTPGWSA